MKEIGYRDFSRDNYKSEILSMLTSFKQKISLNDYGELCSLCEEVLNGQVFDDASFNKFCKKLSLGIEETE